MKKPPPTSIPSYLASIEPTQRRALQALRRQILAEVKGVEECISYSMPAFRWSEKIVAGFLATRAGCSYYPFSGQTLRTLASDLTAYSQTKSALHFDPARGLPPRIVRKLLRARMKEITLSARK